MGTVIGKWCGIIEDMKVNVVMRRGRGKMVRAVEEILHNPEGECSGLYRSEGSGEKRAAPSSVLSKLSHRTRSWNEYRFCED